MSNRDDALEALRASAWQQQKWGESGTRDELRSARLEAERAKVSALLDVADAIREQTAALDLGAFHDDLADIAHAARKPRG